MKPKRQSKTKPAPKRPGHPRLSAGEPSVRLNGIAPASLGAYAALIGGGEVSAGLRLALEFHRDYAAALEKLIAAFDVWDGNDDIDTLEALRAARRSVKL